jgi:hypothetical protein
MPALPAPVNIDGVDLEPLCNATEGFYLALQASKEPDVPGVRQAFDAVIAALCHIGIDATDAKPIAIVSADRNRSDAMFDLTHALRACRAAIAADGADESELRDWKRDHAIIDAWEAIDHLKKCEGK